MVINLNFLHRLSQKSYPPISIKFHMDDLTYIMSIQVKSNKGVLLCLGAMTILVSMGRRKNHPVQLGL